jgi:hypothetical protein
MQRLALITGSHGGVRGVSSGNEDGAGEEGEELAFHTATSKIS